MNWEEMPSFIPGMKSWGLLHGKYTCVINFDSQYPHYGYNASVRKIGKVKTLFRSEGNETREKAEKAVEDWLNDQG